MAFELAHQRDALQAVHAAEALRRAAGSRRSATSEQKIAALKVANWSETISGFWRDPRSGIDGTLHQAWIEMRRQAREQQ